MQKEEENENLFLTGKKDISIQFHSEDCYGVELDVFGTMIHSYDARALRQGGNHAKAAREILKYGFPLRGARLTI